MNDKYMQSSHSDVVPMICDDDNSKIICGEDKISRNENSEISKNHIEQRPVKQLKIDVSHLDETQEQFEEPSQFTTPEVVVVGLEILDTHLSYNYYLDLNAETKIDHVINCCLSLCKQLEKSHPNAQWIFAGREYWITGVGARQRSLSSDEKTYFEKEMQALVKKFPQLTMIAGTISSYKPIKDLKTLRGIKQRYTELDEYKIEQAYYPDHVPQWKLHESVVDLVIKLSNKRWYGEKIKNTCKIFRHDNVMRHDKIMPFKEVTLNPTCEGPIYVPPKSKYKSTLFQINPGKGTPIEFTVEICREHAFNIARSELRKLGRIDTKEKPQLPLFHFLISEGIFPHSRKFAGQYLVHLDCNLRMAVIRDESKVNIDANIHFYRSNLLKHEPKLKKIYCDYTKEQEEILDLHHLMIFKSRNSKELRQNIKISNWFIKKFNKRHAKPCNEDTSEYENKTAAGKRKRT